MKEWQRLSICWRNNNKLSQTFILLSASVNFLPGLSIFIFYKVVHLILTLFSLFCPFYKKLFTAAINPYLALLISPENLPKNWKCSENLKIFQKSEIFQKSSENLSKIWKSSKNLKIFQKSENLLKIWKSSKNLKIFQKSENLPKI